MPSITACEVHRLEHLHIGDVLWLIESKGKEHAVN